MITSIAPRMAINAEEALRKPQGVYLQEDKEKNKKTDSYSKFERFYFRWGFGRRLLVPWGCMPYFNIVILITFTFLFLLNAYYIIVDYEMSLSHPPIHSTYRRDLDINFPAFVLCSVLHSIPMKFLSGNVNVDGSKDPLTVLTTTSIFDLVDMNGNNRSCVALDNNVLAYSPNSPESSRRLVIAADISSAANSSNTSPYVGMTMYILQSNFDNKNMTLELFKKEAAEEIYMGGGFFTDLALQKTIMQFNQVATTEFSVTTSNLPINENFIQSEMLRSNHTDTANIEFHKNSLLMIQLRYTSIDTRILEERRISFSTFFGSLGGWLGVLSDGWGLLSLVFWVEKMLLKANHRKERFWFNEPQQEAERQFDSIL